MNDKKIKLMFSFTDDTGETTTLEKTYNDDSEIGTLSWLIDEYKYFLHAYGFSGCMTNKIFYLKKGEKVVGENGEILAEG